MIEYIFRFDTDRVITFIVDERQNPAVGEKGDDAVPFWAELERYACTCCPLVGTGRISCPAAMAIKPAVEAFGDRFSYEGVAVTVRIGESMLEVVTSTQNAVRSLIGLELALSSCPILAKLRPMATFHLPFGSREHTIYRAVGMYLIGQYLRGKRGLPQDWTLEGLAELYRHIHVINRQMALRLRAASEKDATVNGLILLDVFAQNIDRNVEANLDAFDAIFEAYFKEPGPAVHGL